MPPKPQDGRSQRNSPWEPDYAYIWREFDPPEDGPQSLEPRPTLPGSLADPPGPESCSVGYTPWLDDRRRQDTRPWVERQPPPAIGYPRIDPRITEDYQRLLEQVRRALELQPTQIVIPADQVEIIKGIPESEPDPAPEPDDGDRVRRLIRKRNRSEGDGPS